jgi:hypothetical protein
MIIGDGGVMVRVSSLCHPFTSCLQQTCLLRVVRKTRLELRTQHIPGHYHLTVRPRPKFQMQKEGAAFVPLKSAETGKWKLCLRLPRVLVITYIVSAAGKP